MKLLTKLLCLAASVMLVAALSGCSGGGSSGGTSAAITDSASITDGTGASYQHVYVTVTGVWLHVLATAEDVDNDPYWVKVTLPSPVTVDLTQLANGNMQTLFAGVQLPSGIYRQVRVFLASTEGTLTASASALGLTFNNEVIVTGDSTPYPLRIPAPHFGIKLVPETPIIVTNGGNTAFAIDFDANEDIVQTVKPGTAAGFSNYSGSAATTEFILKPRLKYFDLNSASAISGTVTRPDGTPFANYTAGSSFEIKAEQVSLNGTYRVVSHATKPNPDGTFTLYPLPVFRNVSSIRFANTSTASYDVVLRGSNVQTNIVTSVRVHAGTNPGTGPSLGPPVTLATSATPDYDVNVEVRPFGAWVTFYQTLPGDPAPYEIRYRHLAPYDRLGRFFKPIALSSVGLQVAPWNYGGALTFAATTPVEGLGSFTAIAEAAIFGRDITQEKLVTPLTTTLIFNELKLPGTATWCNIMGSFTFPAALQSMDINLGSVFAVQGGMIIDRMDVDSIFGGNGVIASLPCGISDAFYSLYTVGWNNARPLTSKAMSTPLAVDLEAGSISGLLALTMGQYR